MKKSIISLTDEIRGRLDLLESSLPKRVDAMAVSPLSKLPFKALLYRETLIWRMMELGRAAFENFERDRLVAAIVLTRAAVETSAALWYLCVKVGAAVESDAVGDIDDYLMKLVMGSKTNPNLPQPINVLTFVDCVSKDVAGFRQQYDNLSEIAHPNWAGTSLLYSKTDTEKRVADFGQNIRQAENTKRVGIVNLSVALAMFERSYSRIADLVPTFAKLCESRLKNGKG